MAKSLFKRGYATARDEAKKAEARRAAYGKKLFEFFLPDDGDEADVVFLNEEPINCYVHQRTIRRNGKERFETVICTQDDDCPDCEDGDRPTYKGAYLLVDLRPYETKDDKGKKITKEMILRFYLPGNRVVSQLDRINSKYHLANRVITIARNGKGTKTNYIVERTDDTYEFTDKELKALMTDEIKKLYNGSDDSFYDIIEEQLNLRMSNIEDVVEDREEDEDEETTDRKARANLVPNGRQRSRSTEEDESEEKPAAQKPTLGGKKSLFKATK